MQLARAAFPHKLFQHESGMLGPIIQLFWDSTICIVTALSNLIIHQRRTRGTCKHVTCNLFRLSGVGFSDDSGSLELDEIKDLKMCILGMWFILTRRTEWKIITIQKKVFCLLYTFVSTYFETTICPPCSEIGVFPCEGEVRNEKGIPNMLIGFI